MTTKSPPDLPPTPAEPPAPATPPAALDKPDPRPPRAATFTLGEIVYAAILGAVILLALRIGWRRSREAP